MKQATATRLKALTALAAGAVLLGLLTACAAPGFVYTAPLLQPEAATGFNAKPVQIWMGHHSPAFTMAVYVHLLPDDLPEAPNWLDHGALPNPTKEKPLLRERVVLAS